MDFLYKSETFAIIGAAMEVHKTLGCGFVEAIYEEALTKEFVRNNIPFEQQKEVPVFYKGEALEKYYKLDLLCYDAVIVELKAVSAFAEEHEAQILSYMKATQCKIGLLINFGTPRLQYKRYIL
jgi:GxxExxY protein